MCIASKYSRGIDFVILAVRMVFPVRYGITWPEKDSLGIDLEIIFARMVFLRPLVYGKSCRSSHSPCTRKCQNLGRDSISRGPRNGAFGKPCPCPRDTRHFRLFENFVVSQGSSSKALVLLVRIQIRHFGHFRQKPPLSGGTKARFTKAPFSGPRISCCRKNWGRSFQHRNFAGNPSSKEFQPATALSSFLNSAPGKWGRQWRSSSFNQIPWNPVKVRLKSGGCFEYFLLFLLWGGEGGVRGARRGGFTENPSRGGVFQGRGAGARGWEGVCREFGWGEG